jgi:hypothetical protein
MSFIGKMDMIWQFIIYSAWQGLAENMGGWATLGAKI